MGKIKKVSDEKIIQLCSQKHLQYLGRFVRNQETYLRCICADHCVPYEFEISYKNLRNCKSNCPKCSGKQLTTQDIKYKVESILKLPVEIVGEYTNMKTPIKTKCLKCGNTWDANVVSLCQGSGCKKCKRNKPLKTHDKFVEEVAQKQPNLTITSLYKGDAKPISFKCNLDGFEGTTLAGRLLSGNTHCSCCSKKKMHDSQCLSHQEFVDRLKEINPDIEVCSQYDGYDSRINFKCLKHNIFYTQSASGALNGKCGCVQCVSSKGERRIAEILDKNNINYLTQFQFKDCKDIKSLPFDFYLPQHNICIEYQGKQHYEPVQFGGCSLETALAGFEITKKHDKIKAEYCDMTGITLLAIPYTEFDNLEKIIKNNV